MVGAEFDAALVGAADGDELAFAVLWRAFQPSLLRYLRVVIPGMAEDVASETWLEMARGLGRFDGDERGFGALLFTIARRRALDARRRQARQRATPVPTGTLARLIGPDDPQGAVLEALSTRSALGLIATLPPEQAEVIVLRVVAGLEVGQVAAIVGKKPGTVRVLAHRGLRRLAERLGEQPGAGSVTR